MLKKFGFIFGISIVLALGYAIYTEATKSGCRSMRLACQKEVVVFERIYTQEQIPFLQECIRSQGVLLKLQTQKSHYSPSKLFDALDINEVRTALVKEFGETLSYNAPRLDVLIYENDPLDPGKKTKEAKLYAGYLVFSFYIGDDLIYKIQIDFMDKDGKDIAKRIACAKKSIFSLLI